MKKSAMPTITKLVACAQLSNNPPAEQIRGFYLFCKKSGKNRYLGIKTDELITTCEAVYINPSDIRKTTELGQMSSQQLDYYVMCLSRMVEISKSTSPVEHEILTTASKSPSKPQTQPPDKKTAETNPAWMIDLRNMMGNDILKVQLALMNKNDQRKAAQYVLQTFEAESADPRKLRGLNSSQKTIITQAKQILNKK